MPYMTPTYTLFKPIPVDWVPQGLPHVTIDTTDTTDNDIELLEHPRYCLLYTIFYILYTIYYILYNPHPYPYYYYYYLTHTHILYPISYILYPISYILYPLSYILYPLSSILYPISYILYPIPYTLYRHRAGSVRVSVTDSGRCHVS
jgi:hypothetical protein